MRFTLVFVLSLLAAALAEIPAFRETFIDPSLVGHVSKIAHCWDGSIYVAGITNYDYDLQEETEMENIFIGKFLGNQFLFVQTISNTGFEKPEIYDLIPTSNGFVLIATYSGTVMIPDQFGEYLSLEITDQPISVMVASFDDFGQGYWLNGLGVDWRNQYGPFALTGAQNLDDQIFLIGNYFRYLRLGDEALPSEVGAQTFIISFDSMGGDVSVNFAFHEWNDECEREPCLNGGFCEVNYEDDGYYCECLEGFSGKNCEHVEHDEETKEQNDIGMDREKEDWEKDEDWKEEYEEELKEEQQEEEEEKEDLQQEEIQFDEEQEEEEREEEEEYNEEEQEENWDEILRRRKRDLKNPKSETRTAFTHTRSFLNDDIDGVLLFATGYTLDTTSTYSSFISMYKLTDSDIDLEWEHTFVVGKKSLFPSLYLFEHEGVPFIIFAGTISQSTTVQNISLTLTQPDGRGIYVLLANKRGKLLWGKVIEGVGAFTESTLKVSVAANCTTGCDILVAGPSTDATHIDGVKINTAKKHFSFLASISSKGQPNWIKELYENADAAEVEGLEALNGDIFIAGSVKGLNLAFDGQPKINVTQRSAFIAKIGFDDDGWQIYERYVAPIVYSEKHHPKLSFLFLTTGAVVLFIYSLYKRGRGRRRF